MNKEQWNEITNCERLRVRISELDVSENTSNTLMFELANIEDELEDKDKEIESLLEQMHKDEYKILQISNYLEEYKRILIPAIGTHYYKILEIIGGNNE